jgi:hypothetical protein
MLSITRSSTSPIFSLTLAATKSDSLSSMLLNREVDSSGLLGDELYVLKGTAEVLLQMPTGPANRRRNFCHAQGTGYEPESRDWIHDRRVAPIE